MYSQNCSTTASAGQKKLMQNKVKQLQVLLLVWKSFFRLTVQSKAAAVAVSECKSILGWMLCDRNEEQQSRGSQALPAAPGWRISRTNKARCWWAWPWLTKSTCWRGQRGELWGGHQCNPAAATWAVSGWPRGHGQARKWPSGPR